MYDSIVIGAGHAGCEAAAALAKLNKKVLLITGDLNKVALLPCNPSIGGPAKGIVVREIDALGGIMGFLADEASLQVKMLNASKGPAVRALRMQIDKVLYPKIMLKYLKSVKNLDLMENLVESLIIKDKQCCGVVLQNGGVINSKSVIMTTGTYLSSSILIGDTMEQSGPDDSKTSFGLSKQLKKLGFDVVRLKTGTPPRIYTDSIDFSKTIIQPGDSKQVSFSHLSKNYVLEEQEPCYLTHTNLDTHKIIMEHLNESSMYGGYVEGVGPRYCPSIEDKVVRFNDKERHQVFIEPESRELDYMYIQGVSTSMPKYVQEMILRSIPGLEDARFAKYAYAIEYDAVNPIDLYPTLETKIIDNLYTAGQINGTSGYEEAACQGLMAGINCSLKLDGKEGFVLKRDEAYTGVLIDDLVTKGSKEPYRLLTSRAEFRLLLRHDNADLRLTDYGYKLGLINKKRYSDFKKKKKCISDLLILCDETKVNPTKENLDYLKSKNSSPVYEGVAIGTLLKRPELDYSVIKDFIDCDQFEDEVLEQVEIQIKYSGYIEKAHKEAKKILRLDDKKIPSDIDYILIHNLSNEAKEKLTKIKPQTIGQASRIIGVSPADISILMIYLESKNV